ncbi:hypothetical protein PVAP13_2KG542600 [Panicum virgatum]|uniref:Uncharacterized protein n=1 Tax=Panicum virgatum TaxID=38727 RepID=A0A8T0WIF3_PANVG|nr:hypothetical protein PVAP13_2KG542600 [Panicum virgatum]
MWRSARRSASSPWPRPRRGAQGRPTQAPRARGGPEPARCGRATPRGAHWWCSAHPPLLLRGGRNELPPRCAFGPLGWEVGEAGSESEPAEERVVRRLAAPGPRTRRWPESPWSWSVDLCS